LVQALAREHEADGIHVAHVVIDGLIRSERTAQRFATADEAAQIEPQDLALQYLQLFEQRKNSWTHELDVRPMAA
jgi:short-subunit dehydrogenase